MQIPEAWWCISIARFQRRRVFCDGDDLLWSREQERNSLSSVRQPVKWPYLFVKRSQLHNMLSSPRLVLSAVGLCWKIACSKYELMPLQWNAPNPNKKPAFSVDSSSAALMDSLSSLHSTHKKMRAHEYLPLSKVIPLITLSMLNTVSAATSVAPR